MGSKRIPAVTIPESESALGYIAGLVDGEGHIGISKSFDSRRSKNWSHAVRLSITNCDLRVMRWLADTVGGSVKQRDRGNARHRVSYSWFVHAENMQAVLQAIRPYLVIKAEQADVALAFLALKRGGYPRVQLTPDQLSDRETHRIRLLELNRKGPAAA